MPEQGAELPGGEQPLLVRQLVETVHELTHLPIKGHTFIMVIIVATTALRWIDELQIDQAQLSRRQKSEKRWISMSRYISRGLWLPQAPWVGKQGTAGPPQKSNAPQMTPQPRSAFGIKLASLCSLVSLLSI